MKLSKSKLYVFVKELSKIHYSSYIIYINCLIRFNLLLNFTCTAIQNCLNVGISITIFNKNELRGRLEMEFLPTPIFKMTGDGNTCIYRVLLINLQNRMAVFIKMDIIDTHIFLLIMKRLKFITMFILPQTEISVQFKRFNKLN